MSEAHVGSVPDTNPHFHIEPRGSRIGTIRHFYLYLYMYIHYGDQNFDPCPARNIDSGPLLHGCRVEKRTFK